MSMTALSPISSVSDPTDPLNRAKNAGKKQRPMMNFHHRTLLFVSICTRIGRQSVCSLFSEQQISQIKRAPCTRQYGYQHGSYRPY